ncbi:hypothetical protein ACFC7A_31620 [Streptomyces niveus]|uniref:hypothetical protein n=1 Tax=Streptomyces niveus TaxID=193462 RepID=UPI0035D830DB
MDPRTYNALYGPARLTPEPRRTAAVLLTAGLWLLTVVSLAWLGFLVAVTALWSAAEGMPVGSFLLCCAAGLGGGVAVLVAVRLVPVVRRMSADLRRLLLAALACPVPLVLAITMWFQTA